MGSRLGPYEILSAIGAGGRGEVYKALDPRVGREVAIKVAAEKFGDALYGSPELASGAQEMTLAAGTKLGPYVIIDAIRLGAINSGGVKGGSRDKL